MANIIETITGDRRLSLGNESFVRKMSIGTAWTKIRIGLRCSFSADTSMDMNQVGLAVGVCQGDVYPFSSGNCVDFIGIVWPSGFPSAFPNGLLYHTTRSYQATTVTTARKVTNVIYPGTNTSAGWTEITYKTATHRSCLFFDITKGASYTTQVSGLPSSYDSIDITQANYLAYLENELLTSPFNKSPAVSLAYPGEGLFDSVCVHWSNLVPLLEISDLNVVRFY